MNIGVLRLQREEPIRQNSHLEFQKLGGEIGKTAKKGPYLIDGQNFSKFLLFFSLIFKTSRTGPCHYMFMH